MAEGAGRNGAAFRQFLGYAAGSASELDTQLDIARQLGLGHNFLPDCFLLRQPGLTTYAQKHIVLGYALPLAIHYAKTGLCISMPLRSDQSSTIDELLPEVSTLLRQALCNLLLIALEFGFRGQYIF
ncbi:MAG: four helix bundle protein [Nitrosomonadaceae bacterium]